MQPWLPKHAMAATLTVVLAAITANAESNGKSEHCYKVLQSAHLIFEVFEKKISTVSPRPTANSTLAGLFGRRNSSAVFTAIPGSRSSLDVEQEIRYVWAEKGNERELSIDWFRLKSASDGKTNRQTFISRYYVDLPTLGRRFKVADAPPHNRAPLEASYGTPLYRVKLADDGTFQDQKSLATPDAAMMVKTGSVGSARLFHPPHLPAKRQWTANVEFAMLTGNFAQGTFTYTRIAEDGDVETYSVSGVASNDNSDSPEEKFYYSDSKFVVTGQQTFNRRDNDWAGGSLEMSVSHVLKANGSEIGRVTGTMSARLTPVSDPP